MKDKKLLAIIPARGGSKRIPRKNIKDFLGKPIIAYSIETALKSKLFDEVMVSTDDEEIAEVAKKYGAKVPFMRSKKNADDHATTADVISEVIEEYRKQEELFDIFCCIYPATPFITPKILKLGLNLLKDKNFNSVFPIVQFSHPIQRTLKITDGKIEMMWPENLNVRSQDFPIAYHDVGQFYWMKTNIFLEEKKLFTENSGAIILKETESQDIDNLEDWKMAEIKYNLMTTRK
ncbi:MAG: pseudaminic acid cytidylyltransferase [Candidatus Moranbacteria bacterium]|nr:pseudaminic acid cytidylyltransferase [Candidatus Moranbacteria bacterium]